MVVATSPRSMAQVAAVLAFVISHTTFLAAQDDETGRCPLSVFKPQISFPSANLLPFGHPPSCGKGGRCIISLIPSH